MRWARASRAPLRERVSIALITACVTALALAGGGGASASPSSIPAAADAARESARARPADCDAARARCDEAIEALVRRWFGALSDPAVDPSALDELLAAGPLEISLDGDRLSDRAALVAWASGLRDRYARIEFELDAVEIDPQRDGLRRAHVAFDRRALDRDGYTHWVRREQSWLVELGPGGTPVVRAIEERQLLPFPGAGPGMLGF